jgi:hypothetical protein
VAQMFFDFCGTGTLAGEISTLKILVDRRQGPMQARFWLAWAEKPSPAFVKPWGLHMHVWHSRPRLWSYVRIVWGLKRNGGSLNRRANSQWPRAALLDTAPPHNLAADLQAQKLSFSQSLSPPEAAEAGAHTVGHSPQGCRPFSGFPASQLLVLTADPPAPLPSESAASIA